ncbi:efflux RND transporter periplasmic adaptor subunit [Deinococcus geothermalis]|uniref:Secretion protein HlyD n=1 Tax=Deinococcus geothermalis (strain DSM 11300 / CIP 105573 / AG-3a) TaxID=319795 RepID=Q1IWH3_DEIGD|nr:HlyD family efflux transporter periplasmic adaptor subunit [Deinococcus geothermalis]ABF46411.1 secretion protein HlyD [Deinococcus geothermalis DSM 11300]
MTRFSLRAALPLTLLLLLAACSPAGKTEEQSAAQTTTTQNNLDVAPAKTTALAVQTVPAVRGSLTVQRTVTATLKADRDSQVAAQTGGTVIRVLAQEGEHVRAGQVVVQLDDTQQRQALDNARLQLRQAQINLDQTRTNTSQATASLQAAVQAAEANLQKARQDAASAANLYALGGISQADLAAARSAQAQAESQLAQARNNLAQNGRGGQGSLALLQVQVETAQAGVRQAEENLARTQVRAPFAGVLASLAVDEGEFAAQGSPVFRLVGEGSLKATFNVTPGDARALTPGTQVNLDYGGQTYIATVQDASGVAGSDRLVPVTVRVGGGANLPVGGTAQVRYRAALGNGVLVPTPAIQVDGGENAVYVAEDGVARRVPVTVVAEAQGRVAVRGLDAGAHVISPVPASLQDGASIRETVRPDQGRGETP